MKAIKQGLITEDQIDKNVIRNVTSLFRQGIGSVSTAVLNNAAAAFGEVRGEIVG